MAAINSPLFWMRGALAGSSPPFPLSLRERGDARWASPARFSPHSRRSGTRANEGNPTFVAMDPTRRVPRAKLFPLARQLREQATPAERHAWYLLRNRGVLGLKFRRQHVIHGFIVDFCCLRERIVLELEGNVHDSHDQRVYDRARVGVLTAAGFMSSASATRM